MDLQRYVFGTHEVRVLMDDLGDPLFVAADVAVALEYRMASDMTRSLSPDEKGTRPVRTPGGEQSMTVITEPGLYRAVFLAKTEKAESFRRWVTHDVIPSIRKTGRYEMVSTGAGGLAAQSKASLLRQLAETASQAADLAERVEEQQRQLEAQAPKVEAHARFLDSNGTMSLRDTAKCLGLREQPFIQALERDRVLYRTQGSERLRAYAEHEEVGRFVHRAGTAETSGKAFTQVRVTPTGLDWLSRKYKVAQALPAGGELGA